MSGIAGILSLDGAPVDARLMRRMTSALARRGPDAHETWLDGPVGLAHALLATSSRDSERQPRSLDQCVWITADVRLDDRRTLAAELESEGRGKVGDAGDAELILHAYLAWGEACVTHLLGDFAFAIWDARSRRLFCARDHFGVKPFYYAHGAGSFVFSNSLNLIRMHPDVRDALNELAVADFLLFGWNQDPTTTAFADVHRLPAAHGLACDAGGLRIERYWTVPDDGHVRYRRAQDYVDRFRELFDMAVADRLPDGPVGVSMSGGLDSTSVAATAARIWNGIAGAPRVRAHTVVYDTLLADEERRFASMAAGAIGADIAFVVADHDRPLERWDDGDLPMPEPCDDPFLRLRHRLLIEAAAHSRVLLSGEGADELLFRSYVLDLSTVMPPHELAAGVVRSLVAGLRPAAGIRHAFASRFRHVEPPPYPAWMNAALTARHDLRTRWADTHATRPRGRHPLRSDAHARLASHVWSWYCEASDPGVTGIALDTRYPFLDVRLVSYLLAVPPFPWFVDKRILREAMCGALPDALRLRAKAPLADDPLRAWLRDADRAAFSEAAHAPELADFVERAHVPRMHDSDDPWLHVRPLCLDAWLRRLKAVPVEEAMLR